MWNEFDEVRHRKAQAGKRYQVLACKAWENLALRLEQRHPEVSGTLRVMTGL
jgi:hypothetical protein